MIARSQKSGIRIATFIGLFSNPSPIPPAAVRYLEPHLQVEFSGGRHVISQNRNSVTASKAGVHLSRRQFRSRLSPGQRTVPGFMPCESATRWRTKKETAPTKAVIARRRRRRGNLLQARSRGPRLLPPGTPTLGRRPSEGRNNTRLVSCPAARPQADAELANISRAYDIAMRLLSAGCAALVAAVPVGRPARDIGGGRSGASQHGIPDQHLDAAINDCVSRPSRRVNNFAEAPEAEAPRDRHDQRWRRLRAPSIETDPHDCEERPRDRTALATRLFINQLWQATVRRRARSATTPCPRISFKLTLLQIHAK
jgi:hypothetical protein